MSSFTTSSSLSLSLTMGFFDDGDIKVIRFEPQNNIRILVGVTTTSRRKWQVIEEESEKYDPMEKLGDDLMMKIFGCLGPRSLVRALVVSRSWFSLASSDSLWSPLFQQLLVGKAHIPRCCKVRGLSKLALYSRAVMDSKRICIMGEDLYDHAWDFHFSKAAPDYWRDLDPYWIGEGPPMRRHFHPDGSITADPEDNVWGGHECSYTVASRIHEDGSIRENYVRINHWPWLTVSRREDWGWVLSNSMCMYSSAPDAAKQGGTGPMFETDNYFFSSD